MDGRVGLVGRIESAAALVSPWPYGRIMNSKTALGGGLLASAFAPMIALVAIVRFPELGLVSWAVLGLCGLAVSLLGLVLRSVKKVQGRTIETKTVRHADERVLAFTSAYVIPLVVAAFASEGAPSLAAAGGLVVLLAIIYVRAGLYHLNPMMAILGYRLYEVTLNNETITMLLTRAKHIPQAGKLKCRYLGDNVAIQIGAVDGV